MPRILIVDDEEDVHALVRAVVRRAKVDGLTLEHALDGQEALERLALGGVDLVLTDLNMPRLTGIQLIDRMRASGDRTPVAIVGGLILEEHPEALAHVPKSELLSRPAEVIAELLVRR